MPRDKDADRKRALEYYNTHKKEHKAYLAKNPQVGWRTKLKRNYNMTPARYFEMLEAQGGKCAICKAEAHSFPKPLVVDHDHETGVVRGLLCANCNHGLGRFKDSLELMRSAVAYLEKESPWQTPATTTL